MLFAHFQKKVSGEYALYAPLFWRGLFIVCTNYALKSQYTRGSGRSVAAIFSLFHAVFGVL